jgi:hypothetical protein
MAVACSATRYSCTSWRLELSVREPPVRPRYRDKFSLPSPRHCARLPAQHRPRPAIGRLLPGPLPPRFRRDAAGDRDAAAPGGAGGLPLATTDVPELELSDDSAFGAAFDRLRGRKARPAEPSRDPAPSTSRIPFIVLSV